MSKTVPQHDLIRTSPKGPGQKFIGTCIKCGRTDLSIADAAKYCDNPSRMAPDEVLLHALEGDPTDV